MSVFCFVFVFFILWQGCFSSSTSPEVTSDSPWHLVIGGRGSNSAVNSVELFNWQTGSQCLIQDIPVAISGHTGSNFRDVPIFCGGYNETNQVQKFCYQFVKADQTWKKISSLLEPAKYGVAVNAPSGGFYLFGGVGNSLSKSQVYLGNQWQFGPNLFHSTGDYGQCAVQYNDSLTIFFGGIDSRSIVLFDWSRLEYTLHSRKLNRDRVFSICDVIKRTNEDTLLVAVAGGLQSNSKGMELWNPVDDTLEIVSDVLPPEEGRATGLHNAQMISINDQKELLLYGGIFESENIISEGIWRFTLSYNNWIQLRPLIVPRAEHLVLPVSGVQCP